MDKVVVEDRIGKMFLYALKDRLRKSSFFKLVEKEADAGLRLRVLSSDGSQLSPSVSSILSLVVTTLPDDTFLRHQVTRVGSDRVEDQSLATTSELYLYLDKFYSDYKRINGVPPWLK